MLSAALQARAENFARAFWRNDRVGSLIRIGRVGTSGASPVWRPAAVLSHRRSGHLLATPSNRKASVIAADRAREDADATRGCSFPHGRRDRDETDAA
jgi:hypothetical protein